MVSHCRRKPKKIVVGTRAAIPAAAAVGALIATATLMTAATVVSAAAVIAMTAATARVTAIATARIVVKIGAVVVAPRITEHMISPLYLELAFQPIHLMNIDILLLLKKFVDIAIQIAFISVVINAI